MCLEPRPIFPAYRHVCGWLRLRRRHCWPMGALVGDVRMLCVNRQSEVAAPGLPIHTVMTWLPRPPRWSCWLRHTTSWCHLTICLCLYTVCHPLFALVVYCLVCRCWRLPSRAPPCRMQRYAGGGPRSAAPFVGCCARLQLPWPCPPLLAGALGARCVGMHVGGGASRFVLFVMSLLRALRTVAGYCQALPFS